MQGCDETEILNANESIKIEDVMSATVKPWQNKDNCGDKPQELKLCTVASYYVLFIKKTAVGPYLVGIAELERGFKSRIETISPSLYAIQHY